MRLQLALVSFGCSLARSTKDQSALPDGILGAETESAVRRFQSATGLVSDGVVGKKSLAMMDRVLPAPQPKTGCCSTPASTNESRASALFVGANFRGATSAALVGGITLPTSLRFLTSAQQATARSVFGSSLDFTRIVLSNATGVGGRPFTAAVPLLGAHFVVISAGTFTPSRNLLIHELAHAWQSQHSLEPKRFMLNSIASQGIADELLSKFGVDASAYYYVPGKNFGLYGAEQIACQVESGVGSIVFSLGTVPPHMPHPLNELSLSVPRWEVRGAGVVTSC